MFSQRLRKYTFTAVHTKTHKRRFQIYPLWRAFSNLRFNSERLHRLRVDGRPKRKKSCVYYTSVFVWTGSYNRTPLFRSPKGNGKKFEIAEFRNDRGSLKFVTVNHLLIKYSTLIKLYFKNKIKYLHKNVLKWKESSKSATAPFKKETPTYL